MIVYKDMTFCSNRGCKKECRRKLTDEVLQEADSLGLWLSVADFDCGEEVGGGKILFPSMGEGIG